LETESCRVYAEPGDVENDRTVWFGAMYPLTGPQADIAGIPNMRAIDLARRDFAQFAQGIPAQAADAPSRPFAFVGCDDATGERASAAHLVNDLRVPAVLGFKSSSEMIDLSTSLFLPQRVFVLTTNFSALITSIPEPPGEPHLVWRSALSSADSVVPVSLFVEDVLEPRVRAAGLRQGEPMRVAFVRPRTAYALPMAEALMTQLRFNGKSVIENGAAFREIVFDDPTVKDHPPDFEAVGRAIADDEPHVVVYVGEDEVIDAFARASALLSARPGKHARPYYLTMTNLEGDRLFAFLGKDASLRRRFFGVSRPGRTPANVKMTMHYNETFAEKATLNFSPADAYDATYLLAYAAYAAYAAGDAPLTGPTLARAVARLVPPGKPVDVGPTHIFEAVLELRAGRNVDLRGAANRFDFDLATGESPADFVIQCVGVDAAGAANDGIESGLALDGATHKLAGTMKCP
jgi:branched-chain amino acid transport system substrate-binding protein